MLRRRRFVVWKSSQAVASLGVSKREGTWSDGPVRIRTGGPALTEDVLAELIVSNRVLGTTEILLLNHTGCGFTTFTDDELNARLSASTGDASPAPMRFFSFRDPAQNTLEQIEKVRAHPWIAMDVPVRGFIFDVETGLLREVHRVASLTAA